MSKTQNLDIYKTILHEERKDRQTFWVRIIAIITSLTIGFAALAFC